MKCQKAINVITVQPEENMNVVVVEWMHAIAIEKIFHSTTTTNINLQEEKLHNQSL